MIPNQHPFSTLFIFPLSSNHSLIPSGNMSHFYFYERRQRRTAITLLLNMGVLLIMYCAARRLLGSPSIP